MDDRAPRLRVDPPTDVQIGLMHARMSHMYCELTFNFDLAIPSAVNALRLMGAPPPERVSGGMVAYEAGVGGGDAGVHFIFIHHTPRLSAGSSTRAIWVFHLSPPPPVSKTKKHFFFLLSLEAFIQAQIPACDVT